MSLLNDQSFLAQQAVIAALTGNESISSLLTPAISTQQGIGQPNDPFLAYLQGQQGYATSTDQTYQNELQSTQQQAAQFAGGNLESAQILAQINANGGMNSNDPNTKIMIQNYNSALGNESNEYQSYLNQENLIQQNYKNAINTFQNNLGSQQGVDNTAIAKINQDAAATLQANQQQQLATQQIEQTEQEEKQAALNAANNPKTSTATAVAQNSTTATPQRAFQTDYPQSNDTGVAPPLYQWNNNSNVVNPQSGSQSNVITQTPTPTAP